MSEIPASADARTPTARADEVARPASSRRSSSMVTALQRLALLVVLLVAWEVASGRMVDDFLVSRPSEVFPVLWDWIISGELWFHASSTFTSAALGFVAGGLVAIVVGYALGQAPRVAAVVEPFITALYSMPKLALVPLMIMWFGIGQTLQVATAALIVFFLMFYNTFFGIRDVSQSLVDAIRIMGGSRWDVAWRVRLPSALIWVVAGLKISVPQALVGVVVAELLASNRGLGHLVAVNAGQFKSDGTFAALTVLLVIGFTIDRLVGLATRRALLWKDSER